MSLVATIDRNRPSTSKREEFKGRLKAMRIRIKKKRELFVNALKSIETHATNRNSIRNVKQPAVAATGLSLFVSETSADDDHHREEDMQRMNIFDENYDDGLHAHDESIFNQEEDTIRSIEVSFLIDNQLNHHRSTSSTSSKKALQLNTPRLANKNTRHSLASRTSTPIFLKSSSVVVSNRMNSVFEWSGYHNNHHIQQQQQLYENSSVYLTPKSHIASSAYQHSLPKCCSHFMSSGGGKPKKSAGGSASNSKKLSRRRNSRVCNKIDYMSSPASSSSLSTSSYMTSRLAGRFQNCGEFKIWFV